VDFAGSRRYIGFFGNKDEAVTASATASEFARNYDDSDLSPEQLESHIIAMREAARAPYRARLAEEAELKSTRRVVQQLLDDMIVIVRENVGDETSSEDEHTTFTKLPSGVPNKEPSSSSKGVTFKCPKCTKDYFYRSAQTAKASFSNHLMKCSVKVGEADESDGARLAEEAELKSTRSLVQQVLDDMIVKEPSSSSKGVTFNCPKCTKDYFYRSAQTANASFSNHLMKCSVKVGEADESDGAKLAEEAELKSTRSLVQQVLDDMIVIVRENVGDEMINTMNRVASGVAGVDMTKSGNLCDDALTNPSLVSSETTPRSNTVEAMIIKGGDTAIYVAPGRLGLTVTTAAYPGGPRRGARIDSISLDCPFRDKVSVGDIIITINDKEVMTSFDFSVGAERTRKLGIIRGANAIPNKEPSSSSKGMNSIVPSAQKNTFIAVPKLQVLNHLRNAH
jgi:predicted RNA-binding Zn-ribbon protein involved in translation (DUF1610 family)